MHRILRFSTILGLSATSLLGGCGDDGGQTSDGPGGGASSTTSSGVTGGGGAGGDGGGGPTDQVAPLVHVAFPSPVAATRGAEILVRGQTRDSSPIVSVLVEGVAATSADGFASWSAPVDLVFGDNDVEIVATDAAGNATTSTLTVRRRDAIERPFTHERDPNTGLIWMLDIEAQDLRTLDPSTGIVNVISPNDGPLQLGGQSIGFALDLARSRAVVLDRSQARVVAVDLATGARTGLTLSYTGGLAPLANPIRVAIDPVDDVAYVLDLPVGSPGRVVRIDLSTLETDLVAEDAVAGTGHFTGTTAIDFDDATGRLIGLNRDLDAVYGLDPSTGTVTLLSSNASPANDAGAYANSVAIEVDPDRQVAYVFDFEPRRVFSADISGATGERHLVTANGNGDADMSDLRDLVLADDGMTILAVDAFAERAFEIDVATGARDVIADNAFPEAGPAWQFVDGMAFDLARERAILTNGGSLLAVDGRTGLRTELSSDEIGVGPNFDDTWDVFVDSQRDRYVVVGGGQMWTVDPDTGDRALLSGSTRGSGPSMDNAYRAIHDTVNDRYLVVAGDVIAVDPSSGDRTVLSAAGTPEAIPTSAAIALALDPSRDRMIVLGYQGGTTGQFVVAVDLTTGARSVVDDDSNAEASVSYDAPYGLALLPGTDRLVIADLDGRLVELNLATGAREVLVETLAGPYLERIDGPAMLAVGGGDEALALDPRLYVVDFGVSEPSLAVVDPETGSMATLSR